MNLQILFDNRSEYILFSVLFTYCLPALYLPFSALLCTAGAGSLQTTFLRLLWQLPSYQVMPMGGAGGRPEGRRKRDFCLLHQLHVRNQQLLIVSGGGRRMNMGSPTAYLSRLSCTFLVVPALVTLLLNFKDSMVLQFVFNYHPMGLLFKHLA